MKGKKSPSESLRPKGWYSAEYEVPLHPTVQVVERERPVIYLPNGVEVTVRPPLGFRR